MISERVTIGLYVKQILRRIRVGFFPLAQITGPIKVCVIVPAFPTVGGITTVLRGIALVTQNEWHIEYMTQYLGPGCESYIIHKFGTRRMTPFYFPFAWLYVLLGLVKFLSLMWCGAGYHLLLPQDGVFSGAMAGLAGKLAGVRVVCMDHSDISLFTPSNSRIFRKERIARIAAKDWPWLVRFMARKSLALYWPSRMMAARITGRLIDHYLIPGVAGDSIEEGCNIIGIPIDRVTRFGSMIDVERHLIPDAAARFSLLKEKGLPADAIIIAIVSRLAPEKSLDIALECISLVSAELDFSQYERVRVVIAGDGPLGELLEKDVRRRGLEQICLFWGNLPSDEVLTLLGISDIFLYTSMRGACMAMAVLEAMASGCAVIASTEPLAHAVLLADGRGIAVPAGDIVQISEALLRLLNNVDLCRSMGMLAREYISVNHNSAQFKHILLHSSGYANQDELVDTKILETEQVARQY